jgi:hypothetical protein
MNAPLNPAAAWPTPMRATTGPAVQLVSGAMFDFLHPERAEFYVDDIAHAWRTCADSPATRPRSTPSPSIRCWSRRSSRRRTPNTR